MDQWITQHFLNSALFWPGVALLSVPVIIHLINRLRYRRVRFAAMEFLLASQKRNRRRILIEQLLLLLLRIGMAALVVLLVARLILDPEQLSIFQGARSHHVIVLDDSPSMQDLVDESIVARDAVDIFAVAGIEKPDLSILDDAFLAGFSERLHADLQLRLLARLLEDDIARQRRQNVAQARSFKEMLDAALTRYNNGAIQAADVIRVMIEIRKQQEANEQRKAALGLSDDELAFYDTIVQGALQGLPDEDAWLAELVRDVVKAVRNNLKVDWTRSHRSDVYASVQSAVSRVLRRRKITGEQFDFLLNRLMHQAEERYSDWPMAA